MPNDNPTAGRTEAERQAQALAVLIDAAADDLARNGPVTPDELRQRLGALEAEWARCPQIKPSAARLASGQADRRCLICPVNCPGIFLGRQPMI